MALTISVLQDGPLNQRVLITAQAITTNVTNQIVANPATSSYMDASKKVLPITFRVDKIDYNIEDGIDVHLNWGGTNPQNIFVLAGRGCIDNRQYKDINNPKVAGFDGTITITTEGVVVGTSDNFTIILSLVKKGNL